MKQLFTKVKTVNRLFVLLMSFLWFLPQLSQAQTFTIGTGTVVSSDQSYPTAYGNYYYGARQQFIYSASELQAAGASVGEITSIAFNVTATNGTDPLEDYTISLKNSSTNDLTAAWETGLTQVFTTASYAPSVGWNQHSFQSSFIWDGTSNIIVEICFNNADFTNNASTELTDALPIGTSRVYRADASGVCSSTSVTTFGIDTESRPNAQFELIPPPSCLPPTALLSSNITSNSFDFDWTAGGSETKWNIEWGTPGFTPGTSASTGAITGTSNTSENISGLTAQETYDVYIQADCGGGDVSTWAGPLSVTTACGTYNLPFLESFNTGNIPDCWTNSSLGGSTGVNDLWRFGAGVGFGASNNGKPTGTYAWVDGSSPADEVSVLESPFIDISSLTYPQLAFELFSNNEFSPNDPETANMTFLIRFWDGANWNDSVYVFQDNNPNWFNVAVDLYNFNITGPVKFQFMVDQTTATSSSAFYNDILLDEVQLREAPFDVALLNISNPSNPVTAGFQNIEVTVENNAPIDITQLNLRWLLNGNLQAPANLDLTTNPLTPGEVRNISVAGANLGTAPFDLEVYIFRANGQVDVDQANDTVSGRFCGPIAGTFTVGGAGADFETFADVSDALTCGIDGPVTFNINPGVYTERLVIGEVVGSSATNTITFDGADADDVELVWSTLQEPTVVLDGTDYVTFQNITISHGSTTGLYAYAVQLTNEADWNTFDACKFTTTLVTSTSRAGIAAIASTNVSPTTTSATSATNGNNANNLTVKNSEFDGFYIGITLRGTNTSTRSTNFLIENNTFFTYYYGMYNYGIDDLVIKNNKFEASASPSTDFHRSLNFSQIDNFEIRNNEFNARYRVVDASNTNNGLVINNVGITNGSTSTVSAGYYSTSSSDITLYHNSFLCSAGDAAYFTTTTGLDIRNNIFASNTNEAFTATATADFTELDYNLVYRADGGDVISVNIGGGTTLTDLASAQGLSLALNTVEGDPQFISSTDLKSQFGVLQNNSGIALGIAFDIEGNLRDVNTPDMGAYEYEPVLEDLALIEGSKLGDCFTTGDSISFTVQNTANATIDFAVNNFTLNYTISGPVPATGSVVINTDTLAVGDNYTVFVTGIDFSQVGVYDIDAYISSSWDVENSNDSLNFSVEFTGALTVSASTTTVNDPSTTVDLEASTPFVNFFFKITEIGQFNGSTTGEPIGGTPSYMNGDDYIEITGPPNADMVGYTFEKWNSTTATSPNVVHTFAPNSFLSPDGTLILETFEGTVDSPSDFLYVANTQSSYTSGGYSANVLKDPDGNIVDAVLYSTSTTFNPNTGVTTEWSGTGINGSSSWGIRLEGPDTDDNTNWVQATGGVVQDPNELNSGLTADMFIEESLGTDYTWLDFNGDTISTSLTAEVGPYAVSGVYDYYFVLNSPCGTFSDTVSITANIIASDIAVTNLVTPLENCNTDSLDLVVELCNNGPATEFGVEVFFASTDTSFSVIVDSVEALSCVNVTLGNVDGTNGFSIPQFVVYTALATDQDLSNDTLSVNDFEIFPVFSAPTLVDSEDVCDVNDQVTLVATSSEADVYWYSDSLLTNFLAASDSFITSGINSDTTFYAVSGNSSIKVESGSVSVVLEGNWPSFPFENTLEISDSQGTVVASITYPGSNPFTEVVNLPAGTYTFTPFDSFGDGWNGSGTVTVSVLGETLGVISLPSGSVGPSVDLPLLNICLGNPLEVPVLFQGIEVDSVGVDDITACGANDGQITVVATNADGSTTNLEYSIDGGATFQTSNVFTGLSRITGGYDVVVSNGSCEADGGNFNVTQPDAPAMPTAPADYSVCFGTAMDTLTVTPDSGAVVVWYADAALTTVLDSGSTYVPADTVGVQTIYVAQAYPIANCVSDAAVVEVEVFATPAAPDAGADVTACLGQTVTLSVTGSNVVWSLNPAQTDTLFTTSTATALDSVGTVEYFVSVEDANGCRSAVDSVEVTLLASPAAPSVTPDTAICNGETLPTLSATGAGGTIVWFGNASLTDTLNVGGSYQPTITGTGFREYYVVEFNAVGCASMVATTSVTVNVVPQGANLGADKNFCEGEPLTDLSTGNIPGTSTTWSLDNDFSTTLATGATLTPQNNIGTTTYYAQLTVGACAGPIDSVNVTITPAPAAPVASADSLVACFGDTLPVLSATSAADLEWYLDTLGNSLFAAGNNVDADDAVGITTYYVVAVENGCYSNDFDEVVVTINSAVSLSASGSNVSTCGTNDGAITLTATNGATPYEYALNGGTAQASNEFTGLNAGTYIPSVVDSNGCSTEGAPVVLTAPDQPTAPVDSTLDAITYCDGDVLGDLVFVDTNATPGVITYYSNASLTNVLGTGGTLPMLNNIGTTTYYVTTTVGGCESAATTATVTINATPAVPTASADATYCFGQTVANMTVSGNGGTYNWFRNDLSTSFGTGASRAPQFALGSTTYYVTETLNGCTSDADSVVITINPLPTAPVVANIEVCANDDVFPGFTASGNGEINWYANSSLTNLVAADTNAYNPTIAPTAGTTNFFVTVTDANNCRSAVTTAAYNVRPVPALPVVSGVADYCFNDAIADLTVSTPSTSVVTWENNYTTDITANTVTPPSTVGNYAYEVYVTNQFGCVGDTASLDVNVFELPVLDSLLVTDVTGGCTESTGEIELFVTGGATPYTYSSNQFADTTSNPVAGLAAGNYNNIFVTDANGCLSNALSASVEAPGQPLAPVLTNLNADTICNNEILSDLTAVYDANDTIQEGDFVWFSDIDLTTVVDTGASIEPLNIVGTTTYYVVVDNNGCRSGVSTLDVTIFGQPAAPVITASSLQYCEGTDTAILSVLDNGNTYTWFELVDTTVIGTVDSLTIPDFTAGVYSYAVNEETAAGCSNFTTITITIDSLPVVSAAISADTVCSDATVTLTAGGADTYTWFNAAGDTLGTGASFVHLPEVTTNYGVVGVNTNGCIGVDSIDVEVLAVPVVTATNDTVCDGELATVTVSGDAASYAWANGSIDLSVDSLSAASFALAVTGTATNGCITTDTAFVTVNPTPAVPTISSNAVNGVLTICDGESVVLTSSNTSGNVWSPDGQTTSNIIVNSAGVYTVTTNLGACSSASTDTVEVVVNPLPVADFTLNQPSGFEVELINASSDADTYTWDFGDGSATVATTDADYTYTANGDYTITLVATNDCGTDTATQDVTITGVSADNKDALSGLDIYPNPSRDNVNIRLVNDNVNTLNIRIFDTNGKIIFEEDMRDFNGYYQHIMNFDQYASGVYFINIATDKQSINTKVVITK